MVVLDYSLSPLRIIIYLYITALLVIEEIN